MTKFDPYSTLGVETTASETEVRKAYRALVLVLHPDRNPGNPEAENKFKEVAEAYRTLSDPGRRAEHDASLVAMEDLLVESRQELARRRAADATRRAERAEAWELITDVAIGSDKLDRADAAWGVAWGVLFAMVADTIVQPSKPWSSTLLFGALAFLGAPLGLWVGSLFRTLMEPWEETDSPWSYGVKALPFVGALLGACFAVLLFVPEARAVPLSRLLPAAFAAGAASAPAAALGRAFATGRGWGKQLLGIAVGAGAGILTGAALGAFVALFSGGSPWGMTYYDTVFVGTAGAALGAMTAGTLGALRLLSKE